MLSHEYECQSCGYVSTHNHGNSIILRNAVCPRCRRWARVKKISSTCAFIINGHNAKNDYAGEK